MSSSFLCSARGGGLVRVPGFEDNAENVAEISSRMNDGGECAWQRLYCMAVQQGIFGGKPQRTQKVYRNTFVCIHCVLRALGG